MKTQVVELPLLHDHHSHPLLYASLSAAVSLESVSDKATAGRLLEQAAAAGSGELLLVLGWRSNHYTWEPDELEGWPPLAIFNLSLHQLLLNRGGREVLRQRYGDDVDHVSDPIWYEMHFQQVLNWFARLHASAEQLTSFYRQLETLGVGSAEELLLVDESEIEIFEAAGLLPRTRFWADPRTWDRLSEAARSRVAGLKLFTDGALGSRTAAVSRGYRDATQSHGMLLYRDEELASVVASCFRRCNQLAVHAIGDRAIAQIIHVLERVGVSAGQRVRLEHAQLLSSELAQRARDLGLILSMQPNFSTDSIHYQDRLWPEDWQANNPFRMLIDDIGFVPGEDLIFGSDGMPHGLAAAASASFYPPLPGQRLELDEFLAGYGVDSAASPAFEMVLGADAVSVRPIGDRPHA